MLLLVLMVMVRSGLSIHCWQCNSHHESDCTTLPAGPQDVTKLPENIRKYYVNCDEKNDSFTGRYHLCRKQVQDIELVTRTIRSCGFEESGRACYTTNNPQVKTQVCECREDGCNHSSRLSLNYYLNLFSLLLTFFISFVYFRK